MILCTNFAGQPEYGIKPDYQDTSIYDNALPAFLDLFGAFGVKVTFFVIGRDLQLPPCVRFCREALRRGHALGNHTLSHLPDYRPLSLAEKREEIAGCDAAIRGELGYRCRGFRCPGYYFDGEIAAILRDLGYDYDTSVLPGVGVYLMKLAFGLFNSAGKGKCFGRSSYLFARRTPRPITPAPRAERLWEYPLATCPLLILPIHSTFVFRWGLRYFNLAHALARGLRSHLVYLFHAIDLLDERAAGALASRVGTLTKPLAERTRIVQSLLAALSRHHVCLTEECVASPEAAVEGSRVA